MSTSKLFPARHFASSWRSVSERSSFAPRRSMSSYARWTHQSQECSGTTIYSLANVKQATIRRTCGHRRWLSSDTATNNSILELSSITEPPLDSDILEKPCTVILMDDSDFVSGSENGTSKSRSWLSVFESRIPNECGMSFASISYQNNTSLATLSIANTIQMLKNSHFSRIHDAVLIARGPFSSICAQYYLESLPLQGLIMVDPILVGDDDDENNDSMKEILANNQIQESEYSRFRESSLLLEPNAVPMMVVTSHYHKAWNEASRRVAARHSAEEGPYGMVPIVDLIEMTNELDQSEADIVVDLIDEWVDENVL